MEVPDRDTLSLLTYLNKFSINGQVKDMALKPGMTPKDISMKVGKISKDSWIKKERKGIKVKLYNKIVLMMMQIPIWVIS